MVILHPGFCAEILQIEPDRAFVSHCLQIVFRQFAGKGLDYDIGDGIKVEFRLPVMNRNPVDFLQRQYGVDLRQQALCASKTVDPEADIQAVFMRQLSGQAPADTDIAEVVDDAAKDVPVLLSMHAAVSRLKLFEPCLGAKVHH